MKRLLTLLLALLMVPAVLPAGAETLQGCHRVTLTKADTTQANKSVVRLWKADTVLDSVDREMADIARGFQEELGPALPAPSGKDGKSRLDVGIRYSRTGLTWMSFLVQARTTFGEALTGQEIASRTYDMTTGERVLLTDVFSEDSEAWALLEEAVAEGISAYYPDREPAAEAFEEACTRQAIEKAEFTLHGMSLVLHYRAADFYPGKEQLIEVTLFYPQIRPYMTDKARAETDNLRYYKTCALTYDDGPNGRVTRELLDVLMENGVRATFFPVGSRLRGYAQCVLREHDEGHAVATHNFSHVYANSVSAAELRRLRERVDEVHLELLGITPRYARAPGGIWGAMARAKLGWPLIQWTANGMDMREEATLPSQIHGAVLGTVQDGEIILMHDMKPASVEASRMFIPALEERGYMLLTVDELFAKDGVELQPDTAYWRCVDGRTDSP